jgi:hypothetical protein
MTKQIQLNSARKIIIRQNDAMKTGAKPNGENVNQKDFSGNTQNIEISCRFELLLPNSMVRRATDSNVESNF